MGSRVIRLVACLLLVGVALLPAETLAAPLSGDGDEAHIVKSGETFEEIAEEYGVTVTAILVADEWTAQEMKSERDRSSRSRPKPK